MNYPELARIFPSNTIIDPSNKVYSAVRKTFHLLEMDSHHYGTAEWNPLSEIITPGSTVLIKPNLVMHETGDQVGRNVMHTHGSVIRAVADYALLALRGKGKLIVADAPLQCAEFDKIVAETGLTDIQKWYLERGIDHFSFCDLRKEWAKLSDNAGMILKRVALKGDPKGYRRVDLGKNSTLDSITNPGTRFSVTGYDDSVTQKNHTQGRHNYVIAGSVLDADVVLNLPKLKSHMKTGLTGCLKNMVGINGAKDYLPHHRVGALNEGGDEFPKKTLANVLFKVARETLNERAPLFVWKTVRSAGLHFRTFYSKVFDQIASGPDCIPASMIYGGSWYGNDTTWRMVHDMNKILFFADKQGKMQRTMQRRSFSIVDAIIAGEGEGPLSPSAKQCGIILGGLDPLRIDTAAAYIMGFDPNKIPMLNSLDSSECLRFSDFNRFKSTLNIRSNINSSGEWFKGFFQFKPPTGWLKNIEL
jgi:uncharacterized protein (DUF362 family)